MHFGGHPRKFSDLLTALDIQKIDGLKLAKWLYACVITL